MQNTMTPLPAACRWCGFAHGPRCPAVAAMEFHPDGTLKRVEFVQPPPLIPVGNAPVRIGPTGLVPDGLGGFRLPNQQGEAARGSQN